MFAGLALGIPKGVYQNKRKQDEQKPKPYYQDPRDFRKEIWQIWSRHQRASGPWTGLVLSWCRRTLLKAVKAPGPEGGWEAGLEQMLGDWVS